MHVFFPLWLDLIIYIIRNISPFYQMADGKCETGQMKSEAFSTTKKTKWFVRTTPTHRHTHAHQARTTQTSRIHDVQASRWASLTMRMCKVNAISSCVPSTENNSRKKLSIFFHALFVVFFFVHSRFFSYATISLISFFCFFLLCICVCLHTIFSVQLKQDMVVLNADRESVWECASANVPLV